MTARELAALLLKVNNPGAQVACFTQLPTDMHRCIVNGVHDESLTLQELADLAADPDPLDTRDGLVWLRWPGADSVALEVK